MTNPDNHRATQHAVEAFTPGGVLSGLSTEELQQVLSVGTILEYDAGDVVFHEQSTGREWYIVLAGCVRVDVDPVVLGALTPGSTDPRPILTIGAGGGFGELALFDAEPRSASVVATQPGTLLLIITPQSFDALVATGASTVATILHNLVRDLAAKLRQTRLLLLQQLEANHHVRALCEELDADCTLVDLLLPLQKTLVIRDRAAFVLGELAAARGAVPRKEILDVLVFAKPAELRRLLDHRAPPAEAILHGLFSLLRRGQLPAHAAHEQLSYRYAPEHGRRAGTLRVSGDQTGAPFQIDWEVKGWSLDQATASARASLCLTVVSGRTTVGAQGERPPELASMPIQAGVLAALQRGGSGAGYRVLVVHHRTHEVAQTLLALRQLGFQLDAFVGIPYGEASWATSLMLDRASGHRYLCLRATPHPSGPTRYHFDALRSSFLSDEQEREITNLYASSDNTGSYRAAMNALLAALLEDAIRACRAYGERLLLYEDGAYLTPLIYAIYHTAGHPLQAMIRAAVDGGLLVGSVEVTSSGERAQAAAIREHGGRALLPVISGARDDVKLIFEAVGVAEAVLQAASTALGNLGLPTFGFRQVAVLGGNGAIGVRLVEQLAQIQRSVEHLFVVDPAADSFARRVPVADAQAIAARVAYHHQPRYRVAGTCLPLSLPPDEPLAPERVAARIRTALSAAIACDEAVVRINSRLEACAAAAIIAQLAQDGGDAPVLVALANGAGYTSVVRRGAAMSRVTLLAPETVLVFAELAPLLRAGVDTVIGVSGTAAFSNADLAAFLERTDPPGGSDDLVLISGSSKDYEFQQVLAHLNGQSNGEQHSQQARPARAIDGFAIRKTIHPDIGSVYSLTSAQAHKRLILLADGFVVNFFARYEKGVKTEYMDPIMTMQLLGLIRLTHSAAPLCPGLHQAKDVLPPEHMQAFWEALNQRCAPRAAVIA